MIRARSKRLVLIPSEFSGRARIVHCPYCRASLMLVMDESGRGTRPLDVAGFDLAESSSPGHWNVRGGWIHGVVHRCRPSSVAFKRADRSRAGR